MKLANPPGAQFEILVDGKPRSYRDIKVVAIASAEFLKSRNPHSEVAVRDLQSGEVTVVTQGVGPLMSLEEPRPRSVPAITGTPSITIDGEQYDALRKFLLGCAQNERTPSHP